MPDLVIELDRFDEAEAQNAPDRDRLAGGGARPWIAVGVVLFALFALGPAARPGQAAGVRHVADVPVSSEAQLIPFDGAIYIVGPGSVTALDRRTAQPAWQVETPERYYVRQEGELLIGSDGKSSMAIHPLTGHVRWRLPGEVIVANNMVIAHAIQAPNTDRGAYLAVYDLAGQMIWSAEGVPHLYAVDRVRQLVLTLNPSNGALTEYKIRTGEVASHELSQERVGARALYAHGDEVTIEFADGTSMSKGGARSAGIIDGRPVPPPERDDCGSVWCVPSRTTFGIDLYDKATNELVAHGAGWSMVIETDSGLLAYGPESSGAGGAIGFFHPPTRKMQSLRGWMPLGQAMIGRVTRWHGPMFFLQPGPEKTFIGVLDGDAMRVVGSLPHGHLIQCVPTARHLACRVDPELVRVWQLAAS